MKKIFASLLILAVAFSANAQGKKTETKEVKKAVVAPVDHSHDGHNHGGTVAPNPEEKKAETPPNPNAATIILKEENYLFGEVPEGPQVTHEFKFSNTGKEPLILSNVHASCGCTTPSWPKEPILPGKESTILVTYNTQGRPGPFTKSITITSNANEPNKVIYIKGEVVKAEPEKSVPLEQPSLLTPKN
ncbi:MAG: DUF1573 domain-containing protein [Bacteroidetes bacterium]|nr:DUF1573 domain-containing protein [Bacteroidota bacterium]